MSEQPDTTGALPARILIVDDEPMNVDYLEQELEGHGFSTETAANGLEALERVAAVTPDLVLLDVMMPELDGISALRMLKQDPETRLIPVVLMTALNAVEDRVRGIEAGADDFLTKPVDERELLARIRTALSVKRAIDETVGELRSTSAALERFGRQEREVAALVVEWRFLDETLPVDAVGFVARRQRLAAEELIGAFGGTSSEGDGPLVGVFEGPDLRSRSRAALEAALAIVEASATDRGTGAPPSVCVSAAVAAGPALVGSVRVTRGGETRWGYGAEGIAVEEAASLAVAARRSGVVTAGEVAAAVRDVFRLELRGEGTYGVLESTAGEGDDADHSARSVKTIVITDVVGSTRTVERVGDRASGELLCSQERLTRDVLVLFGGEEIDTAGDGVLASFDSATSAIDYARSLLGRIGELGLELRVGIHTGELELVEGSARGIALHVASRIAARAAPGEILVSATTRELAAGAGLVFVDRGTHTLKGVSEPRQVFAVVEPRAPAPVDASDPDGPLPAGLTAREVDVLRLVAVGLSDAEVATQLFLSVRTVNAHLRSIYRKLGVRSRAAAGRFAEENGLL